MSSRCFSEGQPFQEHDISVTWWFYSCRVFTVYSLQVYRAFQARDVVVTLLLLLLLLQDSFD